MDKRSFEHVDSLSSLIECRHRIDIEIDAESVTELIGDEFGIDPPLAR